MFFKVDQDPTRNLLLQYLFRSVRYSLRCVKEIVYAESEKTLQIKAGQNSVSVNQCFSLYNFFFQTSAFFVSKSAFRQASFEENKTVFSSNLFFSPLQLARSNCETPRTWACYSSAQKNPSQKWECGIHQVKMA